VLHNSNTLKLKWRGALACQPLPACDPAPATAVWLLQNIRKKFPLVLGRINQLITRLEALGPAASIDVRM
jgi:hypothetical protein